MQELAYESLSEVAKLIKNKEVSPVEVTELMLSRIRKLNPTINAYITVFDDQVMADARHAEAEIQHGHYRGPLHGIPICIKDIYANGRTTCGSKTLANYVADEDCTAVARLKEAGALVLGKTSTYEFAFGFPTTKTYFGLPRNPWNLAHECGGSSSGTAAASAAGMSYGGMGTCTGGSIRWPAQCVGIVGLKPTYGRVSRAGIYPLSWSLDHAGPLARTVTDAALLLQGCAGYDPTDPACANVPVPDFTERIGRHIRGLKVGLLRSIYEDNCDPKLLGPYNKALVEYEKLGAKFVDIPSITIAQMGAIEWPSLFADCAEIHVENMRHRGDDYTPQAKLSVAYGLLVSSVYYLKASRLRRQVRDDLMKALRNDADVLMLPTVGFQIGLVPEESAGLGSLAGELQVYTPMFNFTGFPAIQVPCGFDSDELPMGLQIAGRPFDETTICQVAYAYEQATKWHMQHPDL
jgi:aspartyl-tRNA(Asn)/glutamyl-tRNA(Gln) amidotransferase subunit A